MWVIFREIDSQFLNLDKHVYALVNDEDILTYQRLLSKDGCFYEIHLDVSFLQLFAISWDGVFYYARKYSAWSNNKQDAPNGIEDT
jgi:hypothetical protein